jgi:small neutral amino acid transporter SnatA (MarC family)
MSRAARPAGAGSDLADAHAALVAEGDVQVAFPVATPAPDPPDWLEAVVRFFRAIAPAMEWVFWIVLAVVVLAVLAFIAREVARVAGRSASSPRC